MGPRYDGEHLKDLLKKKLRDITLKQTLTQVIIPTYDINRLFPVIFTTAEVLQNYLLIIVALTIIICINSFFISPK